MGDIEQTPALPGQFAVIANHLVVNVGRCTCDGPFETYGHRPECGYEPIMTLDELATVLSQAGRTVLELPAPAGVDENCDTWWEYPGGKAWSRKKGRFDESRAARFRGMALAALAAAEHNERARLASESRGDGA